MPWTWIRPKDPALLEGRPLLDLGVGDAQTLSALAPDGGLIVGLDRSVEALAAARGHASRLVAGRARWLPFGRGTFATVLAGDLFHHLDDEALGAALKEVRRVLAPGGKLVAWWYRQAARPAPGAPRFPREAEAVRNAAARCGFAESYNLDLEAVLEPSPPTAGVVAVA